MPKQKLPDRIKELSGTARADRKNAGIKFVEITEVPKPKVWLSEKGKQNFKSLSAMLIEQKMLTNANVHLVTMLAQEMARYEMACRELKDAKDLVLETKSKYKQQSPWVGISNQALKNVKDISSLFGLDPLSSEKFGGPQKPEGKNPIEELLNS